jgi:thiamine-phosphate pyrophosphorylase
LYLVCDEMPDAFLDAALRGGVDVVQLRGKTASDHELLGAAARFAAACARHGALFILNDRPDLVVAAGADGVHLGQDDMPVSAARELLGEERIIGLSTHTADQIDRAGQLAIDYIGVGPVHATPTKPGRPAVGTELVRYAAVHARVPFFAIGGIEPGNLAAVITAGARRVAVVRALTGAGAPECTARALAGELRGAGAEEVGVGRA